MRSGITDFSRRVLFRKARTTAGAGFAGLLSATSSHSQSSAKTAQSGRARVLALIGDRYHNADYIRVSLDKVFKKAGVAVDYTIQYDQPLRNLLKNYQLFVCLRDGMIWPDGYLGPDAYTAYEGDLENSKQFPKATPQSW
ncbi:MAG: hypothetical protein WAM39_19520, partial [Bryobacteraceae bacterium]